MANPVVAEVLSGAPTRAIQDSIREMLRAVRHLPDPERMWERAAESRFLLARLGLQEEFLDILIALTASDNACPLLTRDRDFVAIARVVPLDVILF